MVLLPGVEIIQKRASKINRKPFSGSERENQRGV
jgi:hypothetical protein